MRHVFRYIDGKVVEVTNEATAGPPVPGLGAYSEARPLVSEGLGCLRHQVPQMRRIVEERGLTGVRVRDNGAVELTSRGDCGRRGLLKLRGLVDSDGGYGDSY